MKLNYEQQAFIVRWLARFKSPSDVVALVKEEYGIEVSRQLVRTYNPEQCEPADKWRLLFDQERAAFKGAADKQALASLSFRMQELGVLYRKALQRNNIVEARACLEQAAKDYGGLFTNTRKVQYTPDDTERQFAESLGLDPDRMPPELLRQLSAEWAASGGGEGGGEAN